MLVCQSIRFKYDNLPEFSIPDISLEGGEELLIMGKSGSGKTTILNILGGLLKPMEGEVLINGTSLYGLTGNALDKFRGENIGIVFQKPHIINALSVGENLRLAHYFVGKNDPGLIDTFLTELGIMDKKYAAVGTLSEGEAQRVSIARALVNRPKVILADEPTASLDDENAKIVLQLLKGQARKLNAVLVVVTHDQRVKALISQSITIGEPV